MLLLLLIYCQRCFKIELRDFFFSLKITKEFLIVICVFDSCVFDLDQTILVYILGLSVKRINYINQLHCK